MDQNELYGPCPCGSGKKFKFCCYVKYRDDFSRDMSHAEIVGVVRGHAAGVFDIERVNPEATKLYDEGYEALADCDFENAVRLLKKARTLQPTLFMAWNNEASAHWNRGDFKAAYDVQKEGNERAPFMNVWGVASLVQYARALGKDDEAGQLLARAVRETPVNLFVAERVCSALALDRRHRDILDYISRSQMAEDTRLRFYAAVAHCNLGELDIALPLMRSALDSPYRKMAKFYVECLEDKVPPLSLYKNDWPYLDWSCFPPAQMLDKAMDAKEKNPLSSCGGLAIEAMEVLVSDGIRAAKELIPLIKGRDDDPRWAKLMEGLQWVADDDEKVEKGELPPIGGSGLPVGVISVPDTDSVFPGCVKWRLAFDYPEELTAEAAADRVLTGLLQPYAERYWRGEREDCEIVLLESHLADAKCHSIDCPIALAGRFGQRWDIYRKVLVDFFGAIDFDAMNLTVSHDMVYGGPILKVESQGNVIVFSVAILEWFDAKRR